MAEIRKAKSTDLGSRAPPDKANEQEQRSTLKSSTDDRRSASPNHIGSVRRAVEPSPKDKRPASSTKRPRKDTALSPTQTSKVRDKEREREREKEKPSRNRDPKLSDTRLLATLATNINDIETSEDLDVDGPYRIL
jgi:hypothetical protein